MEGNKKEEIKEECIALLKKAGCDERVVRHCVVVADLALEIAKQKSGVSEELILRGALLHDIGRARSAEVDHGYIGGEIARNLGVDEKTVRIIQRHLGAGITAKEAKELGLPEMDFIPETMEEKIVAYADKLIDNDRRVNIDETVRKMKEKLGEKHPAIEKMRKLQEEVIGKTLHT